MQITCLLISFLLLYHIIPNINDCRPPTLCLLPSYYHVAWKQLELRATVGGLQSLYLNSSSKSLSSLWSAREVIIISLRGDHDQLVSWSHNQLVIIQLDCAQKSLNSSLIAYNLEKVLERPDRTITTRKTRAKNWSRQHCYELSELYVSWPGH